MPIHCCIKGCTSSWWKQKNDDENVFRTFPVDREIGFHSFPKKKTLNDQWKYSIKLCIGQTSFGKNPRVCSAHFKGTEVVKRKRKICLDAAALPSVFANSNYVDYEILNPENADAFEQSTKKIKLNKEALSANAFFPPVVSPGDFPFSDEDVEKVINSKHDDSIHDTADTGYETRNDSTKDKPIFNTEISSTPKRKIRYPGDIDETKEMSPKTMRRNFRLCKNKIKTQAKQIYKLKQKVKRQHIQIQTLKGLLKKLRISFGLSGQAIQSIESTFEEEIIQQLSNGRKSKKYTENVRSFALTLNFYSAAAYNYIRRTFGKHLPHPSTLRNWYKILEYQWKALLY